LPLAACRGKSVDALEDFKIRRAAGFKIEIRF